ncbi:MAG: hypothetical protein AAF483_14075 [Planctomycetota bacterium]
MRPFLFSFLALTVAISVSNLASAQQDTPAERFPPIENSEFYGKKTLSRVTERFEIYDPHSVEELEKVKAMGFDQVILDRAPLHQEATRLGLDVVIANWWTPETKQEVIDGSLDLSRQVEKGRLAGISIMDEPERNTPNTPFEFYIDLYQKLKPQMDASMQNARLEISYWGPIDSWDQRYYDDFAKLYRAADVMRLMPYPDLYEKPLRDVYLMMRRSDRVMGIAGVDIPKLVILQTWILAPKNELPQIPELRVMAYQAMLGGAETLSFFEYKPEDWEKTPGFEAKFEELMQELIGLRKRLAGAEIESWLDENGILQADVSWENGQTATIRVNTNRIKTEDLARMEIQDGSLELQQRPQPTPDPSPNLPAVDEIAERNQSEVEGCYDSISQATPFVQYVSHEVVEIEENRGCAVSCVPTSTSRCKPRKRRWRFWARR